MSLKTKYDVVSQRPFLLVEFLNVIDGGNQGSGVPHLSTTKCHKVACRNQPAELIDTATTPTFKHWLTLCDVGILQKHGEDTRNTASLASTVELAQCRLRPTGEPYRDREIVCEGNDRAECAGGLSEEAETSWRTRRSQSSEKHT